MKKIQHINLDFSSSNDLQQPFYCPLTGELLVISDPYNGVESFPKTVIAVLTEHGSHYVREDFDESDFVDSDDLEGMYEIIKKKTPLQSGILIVELGYYGNHPGDFGAWIFILEIPNAFIK